MRLHRLQSQCVGPRQRRAHLLACGLRSLVFCSWGVRN
jgi:hypothetical protein